MLTALSIIATEQTQGTQTMKDKAEHFLTVRCNSPQHDHQVLQVGHDLENPLRRFIPVQTTGQKPRWGTFLLGK